MATKLPIELTLAILKPTVVATQPQLQEVIRAIKKEGFEIVRTKRIFWKKEEAGKFYGEHEGKFYFPRLVEHATSGPFMALALAAPDAIKKWRKLIGPTKVYQAQWLVPDCLRAKYGLTDTRNGFHGSDSPETAAKELSQVFEGWDFDWWMDNRKKEMERAE